jgi:hypothetical protein
MKRIHFKKRVEINYKVITFERFYDLYFIQMFDSERQKTVMQITLTDYKIAKSCFYNLVGHEEYKLTKQF